MTAAPHYLKPPIVEAVIDLRVEPHPDAKIKDMKKIGETEKGMYPIHESVYKRSVAGEFKAHPKPLAKAKAEQEKVGHKFSTADKNHVFQVRKNGFTFSHVGHYESWEPFRDEAKRLWTSYREQCYPRKVIRVAVRYINRIDIPESKIEMKDYFRTAPEISPDLPQQLAGFFMQLKLPQPDLQAQALINQTIAEPLRSELVSVILDIDVFRSVAVPQDEDSIWEFFEQLHVRKNLLFEACITDKTRRLFQ